MKKLLLSLLMGMMLCPSIMDAKKYRAKDLSTCDTNPVIRSPALYQIGVYVDPETGDLYISPNYDVTGLQITLVGNGITYDATTVSLTAGQVYTDCLDYLDEGTYTLTLSTCAGIISQYTITVEDE